MEYEELKHLLYKAAGQDAFQIHLAESLDRLEDKIFNTDVTSEEHCEACVQYHRTKRILHAYTEMKKAK